MLQNHSDLNIGIIGLGSIGERHLNELVKLGVNRFYALRTNKGAKEINPELAGKIEMLSDKEAFLALDLDGYIISNPTSLHIETIDFLKAKNKPMFVEKPFCNHIAELEQIKGVNENLFQVGFCLRFLTVVREVKKLIDSNEFGRVHHSRLSVGQYLPSWHPYTDYRKEYYSRKELGGGVLRTLSHELDLALHLFGKPEKHKTLIAKTSELEIDTDDYALVLLNIENRVCRIELDFLSKKKYRTGIVYCKDADIHYDVFANSIEVYDTEGKLIKTIAVEPNNMYHDQMKSFLEFVQTGQIDQAAADLNDSIELMKIIADEEPI